MAKDYNSDKEAHRDHTYIVSKTTTDPSLTGLPTEKGVLKFDRQGRFAVSDPGLANEIMQNTSPADAIVTRVNNVQPADRGHRYFFGMLPEMPWKRKKHDAGQEETQGSESHQGDGQEARQEEAAEPDYLHTTITQVYDQWEETLVSWPYAGGLATDNEE